MALKKVKLAASNTPLSKVVNALNGCEFMVKSVGSAPVKLIMVGREGDGRVEGLHFDGYGVKYDTNSTKTVLDYIDEIQKGVLVEKGTFTKALNEVKSLIKPYWDKGRN